MRYLAGRLVLFALTLLLISVVTFAVTHILPGDVATMMAELGRLLLHPAPATTLLVGGVVAGLLPAIVARRLP